MVNILGDVGTGAAQRMARIDAWPVTWRQVSIMARSLVADGVTTRAQVAALPTDTVLAYFVAADDMVRTGQGPLGSAARTLEQTRTHRALVEYGRGSRNV